MSQFIHDPLLTWRLNRESPPEPTFQSERRNSLMSGIEARNSVRPSSSIATAAANGTVPEAGRPDAYRPRNRSSAVQNKGDEQEAKEVQNARAIQVLDRVKEKLTGMDFVHPIPGVAGSGPNPPIPAVSNGTSGGSAGKNGKEVGELRVDMQVDRLIREATNLENLCQHYIGWCSFW